MNQINPDSQKVSYREKYNELSGNSDLPVSELLSNKSPIAWGCGTSVLAYILLIIFIDGGVLVPAVIIGIIVGYFKRTKKKKLVDFLNMVRTEYHKKILTYYNQLIAELSDTHTEVLKNPTVTGFLRNDELLIINNYTNHVGIHKLPTDDSTEMAISNLDAKAYFEDQLLNIKLSDIIEIQERVFDYSTDFENNVMMLGNAGDEDADEVYFNVSCLKNGTSFEFYTFKIVVDYLISNNNSIKLTKRPAKPEPTEEANSSTSTLQPKTLSGDVPSDLPRSRTNPSLQQGNLSSSDDRQENEIVINIPLEVTPPQPAASSAESKETSVNPMEELLKLQKLDKAPQTKQTPESKEPQDK